jgi:peptidyl-prolyl cis-trans isomerase D
MLQTIRERAQGWIAWVIVILISIPFALWGIQSYLGVGAEPVVASVNGVEITERELDYRYRDFRANLREQLGAAYRPELFDDKNMRAQVLDQMIRNNVLLQVSGELGLRASDAELRQAIMGNPAFQKGGTFDNATYERALELQGMVPLQYEDNLRQRLVGTQLKRAIVASEIVLDTELEESVRLDRQQRRLSFVRVPASAFASDEPVSDADISAYYEANQLRFQTPERIQVQYLVLDAGAIAPAQAPGEEALREQYEAELERYTKPEQRRVRHILIAVDAEADSAAQDAAKASIAKIRERIAGGEDFAAVAGELSQDPGSAGQGGDLGRIEQGLMDAAFDEAAFSLPTGQLSEPVRTQFGYHLIEVTEIEPGAVKSFEEVKDELVSQVEKQGLEGQYFDWAERLANLSYEFPDSLEPAAEALGLELQTSDWIERSGGEGTLAHPKVIAAAFSEEVLKEGKNSDVIEPERDRLQAVVLRILEHEEASAKPLEEVRDEIAGILRDQRAADAAIAKAAEMAESLGAGADLTSGVGDYRVEDLGLVSRSAAKVPAEILDLGFRLAHPEQGGASYGGVALADGDAALVILAEVVDGAEEGADQAARAQTRRELAQSIGSAYFDALLADMESRADIERKPLGGGLQE